MKGNEKIARKMRKLQASRDRWKQRSADKQQEIRQLRVTVRDLSNSREHWKGRVQDLEEQLQAVKDSQVVSGLGGSIFFGGYMDKQTIAWMMGTPIPLSSD